MWLCKSCPTDNILKPENNLSVFMFDIKKGLQPTKGFASVGLDGITIGSKSLSTAVPADEILLGFCFKFEHLFFNLSLVPGLTLINAPPNAKPQTLAATFDNLYAS